MGRGLAFVEMSKKRMERQSLCQIIDGGAFSAKSFEKGNLILKIQSCPMFYKKVTNILKFK